MSSKKLNQSCFKIFRFLQLLYEDNADYQSVVEIFKDDINKSGDKTENNIQVVINKYTNAFKVFGIKIEKIDGKYKLMSSLYSMKLTLKDIKSLSILANFTQEYPNKDLSDSINKFLAQIHLRMNNEDKNTFDNITQNRSYNFAFQYLDRKEQLAQCELLCKEQMLTKITYLKKNTQTSSMCVPEEIIFTSRSAYLKAFDTNKNKYIEIALQNILLIENTPQKPKRGSSNQITVFKLKNRLAQNYKFKEGEYLREKLSDGSIIVVNKNDPPEKLLNRLMRYSVNCEILTPAYMRYEFLDLITETLNNYNE